MERSERISQWVASQEIPSDLTVRVGDSVFPLHKAVMVPKCGYIRRAMAEASSKDATVVEELDLSSVPGGADAFEKAARYCYGANFEITARNAAALRCAAAFLDIPQLERRVDEFLAQAGLRTLRSAVAVLRSCEGPGIFPAAEELGLARRAADAVALRICNEALFPTRSPPGWWTAELAALSPASFGKVATALRCRRADPAVTAAAAAAHAELALADVLAEPRETEQNSALVQSVVAVLPSSADAPLPASFLCRLLHAAVNTNSSAKTCRDLELRVAAVLDQATAEDLLGVALDGAGERVANADTVRRVVAAFVERNQASERRTRRASLSSGLGAGADEAVDSSASLLEKVARTVDEVAAELATEAALPVSKFVGVAGAVRPGVPGGGHLPEDAPGAGRDRERESVQRHGPAQALAPGAHPRLPKQPPPAPGRPLRALLRQPQPTLCRRHCRRRRLEQAVGRGEGARAGAGRRVAGAGERGAAFRAGADARVPIRDAGPQQGEHLVQGAQEGEQLLGVGVADAEPAQPVQWPMGQGHLQHRREDDDDA